MVDGARRAGLAHTGCLMSWMHMKIGMTKLMGIGHVP